MSSESRNKGFGKELLVIVLGVLIALAAQSAWSAVSDHLRARRLAVTLREEIRATKLDMEDAYRRNVEYAGRAGGMFEALVGSAAVPQDSLLAWWRGSIWMSHPESPTLGLILNNGDIRILSDSVSLALTRYSSMLESAKTSIDGLNREHLQRAAALRYLMEPYLRWGKGSSGDSIAVVSIDLEAMRKNVALRSAFNAVRATDHNVSGWNRLVSAAADTALMALARDYAR